MGGMLTLEWPLCTPEGYVKNIIPISTSVDHDAWGIAWAEAQRQCIYADPAFDEGYYLPTPSTQPAAGLAAARMVGMLTYRSSRSFNSRFGRGEGRPRVKTPSGVLTNGTMINGNTTCRKGSKIDGSQNTVAKDFKAHSYLRYQGEKFVKRFDANCFIHLTQKMDHHDVTTNCLSPHGLCVLSRQEKLRAVFNRSPKNALVIGIDSDVLFRPEQQLEIADALPEASLVMIPSAEGHDGFLLEFEILGPLIENHLRKQCPWIYESPPLIFEGLVIVVKNSVFGEVESGW